MHAPPPKRIDPKESPLMQFEKSVLVPLGADETFALITEPDRLRRWHTIAARVDLRAGGDYRWTIVPGHSASGTFNEVEAGKRVVFTWGWEGQSDLPPGASTVTITLEPAGDGTIVRLVHDGLTDEQAASHGQGWTHYLDRLVQAGASGEAGPDEWVAAPQQLDAIKSAEATLASCQLVLRGIPAASYQNATCCTEFTVSQVAEHLIGSITFIGGTADAEFPQTAATTLEARVAAAAQPALEAWNRRGLDGTVKVGPNEMPAGLALGILSVEFLVHAWDFARATGQQVSVSDELAGYVLEIAQTIITPEVRGRGSFASEVPAGPDAGILDRLVAFTGRAA